MCVCTRARALVCLHVSVCVCACVCVRARALLCERLCARSCVCVFVCDREREKERERVCIFARAYVCVCVSVCVCVRAREQASEMIGLLPPEHAHSVVTALAQGTTPLSAQVRSLISNDPRRIQTGSNSQKSLLLSFHTVNFCHELPFENLYL